MNAMKLLLALGNVRGSYILAAEEFRQGRGRRIPGKRLWLIAAVIALGLVLVGCAVAYALRLQDMAFGEKHQEYYDGSSQTVTLLSIQGVQGTPGYQATKEWYEWLETYDQDMTVYHSEEAFSEDFGEEYWAYNLYSREMKDKLDEICQKYGLALLGKMYVDPDIEAGCRAIGIPGIFRPGSRGSADWGDICYYANGAFRLEGHVTLPGQMDRIVLYRCHRKSAFSDLYNSVGPEGTYQEWTYTTAYGVEVLMVLDRGGPRGNATMYAEHGDYVYLLTISEFEDVPLPDKAGLEAYAECFDLSVEPQRVTREDIAAAEERREEADAQAANSRPYYSGFRVGSVWHPPEGYDSSIEAYMTYVQAYDDGKRTCYALWDIDGDGEEEAFLGTEDGNLIEMLKMEEGLVTIRFCDYVCQGNVLEDYFTYGFYENAESLTRREGSGHVYKDIDGTVLSQLLYDNETQTWRQGTPYWATAKEIPPTQAQQIQTQHPRIPLTMHPVGEFEN